MNVSRISASWSSALIGADGDVDEDITTLALGGADSVTGADSDAGITLAVALAAGEDAAIGVTSDADGSVTGAASTTDSAAAVSALLVAASRSQPARPPLSRHFGCRWRRDGRRFDD